MEFEEFDIPEEVQNIMDKLSDSYKRLSQEAKNRELDPQRAKVLNKVAYKMSILFDTDAKIQYHHPFNSAGIRIEVPAFELDSKQGERFMEILSDCSTLSISPLINGNISIGVTVNKVFR